jgi:hypothetical protein
LTNAAVIVMGGLVGVAVVLVVVLAMISHH